MVELGPRAYRVATGLGLLAATGLLGLGAERLLHQAFLVGGIATLTGLALAGGVFWLKPEGMTTERGAVLLYRREACPHCDEGEAILRSLQTELGFDLWVVDITGDAALTKAYGSQVPVVVYKQARIASLEVREAEVRDALSTPAVGEV